MKAIIDNQGWVRCGRCKHKLLKILNINGIGSAVLETKCHSCRELNVIVQDTQIDQNKDNLVSVDNFIGLNRKEA